MTDSDMITTRPKLFTEKLWKLLREGERQNTLARWNRFEEKHLATSRNDIHESANI